MSEAIDAREQLAKLVEARKAATPGPWFLGLIGLTQARPIARCCTQDVLSNYDGNMPVEDDFRDSPFIVESANTDFAAMLKEFDRLRKRVGELEKEVVRYRELATCADRKNEQNTMRVEMPTDGVSTMLLQTSNNFNETEIAELFAKTYNSIVHVGRCIAGSK